MTDPDAAWYGLPDDEIRSRMAPVLEWTHYFDGYQDTTHTAVIMNITAALVTERAELKERLAALEAADSTAGYVRIDLNDEALLARLADAIEVPQMYVDGDDRETWLEWQQRAIHAALKEPQ